jgi:hypothetical protein
MKEEGKEDLPKVGGQVLGKKPNTRKRNELLEEKTVYVNGERRIVRLGEIPELIEKYDTVYISDKLGIEWTRLDQRTFQELAQGEEVPIFRIIGLSPYDASAVILSHQNWWEFWKQIISEL